MSLFADPGGVAARDRQLARLLDAVHRSQQHAIALSVSRPDDNELKLLFGRLEAVRLEVELLRRSPEAISFEEIDPKWTGLVPWGLAAEF